MWISKATKSPSLGMRKQGRQCDRLMTRLFSEVFLQPDKNIRCAYLMEKWKIKPLSEHVRQNGEGTATRTQAEVTAGRTNLGLYTSRVSVAPTALRLRQVPSSPHLFCKRSAMKVRGSTSDDTCEAPDTRPAHTRTPQTVVTRTRITNYHLPTRIREMAFALVNFQIAELGLGQETAQTHTRKTSILSLRVPCQHRDGGGDSAPTWISHATTRLWM